MFKPLMNLKINFKLFLFAILFIYCLVIGICYVIKVKPGLILGPLTILLIPIYFFVYKRQQKFAYYYLGIDLDSNDKGDVVELYCYGYENSLQIASILDLHTEQFDIFFDIDILEQFLIRIAGTTFKELGPSKVKVFDKSFARYTECRKKFLALKLTIHTLIKQNQPSLVAGYIDQPATETPKPRPERKFFRFFR